MKRDLRSLWLGIEEQEESHEEVSPVWSACVLGARLDQRFSTKGG